VIRPELILFETERLLLHPAFSKSQSCLEFHGSFMDRRKWHFASYVCSAIPICHTFGLKVKNFHRPTGCIHITKGIDKMARMGDIASAASD
jgi:hypothetical protein